MPLSYVKAYMKRPKNDTADAEAIRSLIERVVVTPERVAAAFGDRHLEPLVAGPHNTQKSLRQINV